MQPDFIPCVTGREDRREYDFCLISPSSRTKFKKAKIQTIIDCLTFGLKLNKHLDPLKHYLWYVDFVAEYQNDTSLVFIVPDCDWLGVIKTKVIAERWLSKVTTDRCLKVPHSYLFDKVPAMGHALANQSAPVHPDWTHSFSRLYKELDGVTKRWTYDSR